MKQTNISDDLDCGEAESRLLTEIANRNESDEALAIGYQAFEKIYQQYSRRLLAFLASRVRTNELEDVHQIVWQRIWIALPEKFDGKNFRAWLFRVAKNVLIDQYRSRKLEFAVDFASVDLEIAAESGRLEEDFESQELLSNCLARLEESMYQIVRSRLEGEDYVEICERLELPISRAHKLFFHAKEQLNRCVAGGM